MIAMIYKIVELSEDGQTYEIISDEKVTPMRKEREGFIELFEHDITNVKEEVYHSTIEYRRTKIFEEDNR